MNNNDASEEQADLVNMDEGMDIEDNEIDAEMNDRHEDLIDEEIQDNIFNENEEEEVQADADEVNYENDEELQADADDVNEEEIYEEEDQIDVNVDDDFVENADEEIANRELTSRENTGENLENSEHNEEERPALGLIMSMNSGSVTDTKTDKKSREQPKYKKRNMRISLTSSMDCKYYFI